MSRGGKVGMEAGTLRERVVVAMLKYYFGEHKVKEPDIITHEVDVILEGHSNPISIKTKTGRGYSGVKLVWTVDWKKVDEFVEIYKPKADILFSRINWDGIGEFCYIPLKLQLELFGKYGGLYFKKPKKETNPRGVEISSDVLQEAVATAKNMGYVIDIYWKTANIGYDPYKRWIDLWAEE
ncbi:ThaI family type II restriction endonuclease [Hydrogenobacter thermophilus]|uniref:ThaI family type II restriction endonuclease n=1 Tax=Hydrogenobacter thermophilus TaxID=940 RepID=UPI0030FBFB7B